MKYLNQKGMTLTEILIALAIFSVVIAGIFAIYIVQLKQSTREYRIAESGIELEIAKTIIERDIAMGGYGLADDYSGLDFAPRPRPIGAINSIIPGVTENPVGEEGKNYHTTVLAGSDALYMMGTALGRYSSAAQGWTFIENTEPMRFKSWSDVREDIHEEDEIIFMEPSTKTILKDGKRWIFSHPARPADADKGTLVYGLVKSGKKIYQPYYIIQYRLGGSGCSSGTRNLERVEISGGALVMPILSCVRDFQVAFGLDTDENGTIDLWDPASAAIPFLAENYDISSLKKRLKQVRVYILVQEGNYDPDYTYSNPEDKENPSRICVGEFVSGTCSLGRFITLTKDQRKYRWRVISLTVTPRNLR